MTGVEYRESSNKNEDMLLAACTQFHKSTLFEVLSAAIAKFSSSLGKYSQILLLYLYL